MQEDLRYKIALSQVPYVGVNLAKSLIKYFGSIQSIFDQSTSSLLRVPGVGLKVVSGFDAFDGFEEIDLEIEKLKRDAVECYFILDKEYPFLLKQIPDAPLIIYVKGDLSPCLSTCIAIVGTRNNSDYGEEQCIKLVRDLAKYECTIISGMAYGIDVIAHREALNQRIPTMAVLGHGLDRVYPHLHRNLADQILEQGGALVTEFPYGTKPDRENFPKRNRIVAGLVKGLIVVQSPVKGGSMITANLAFQYDREVMAIPGVVGDNLHTGCHALIKENRAHLIEGGGDVAKILGFTPNAEDKPAMQHKLILDASEDEMCIINHLREHGTVSIDALYRLSGFSAGQLSQVLLQLEFKDLIRNLPGKHFKLL